LEDVILRDFQASSEETQYWLIRHRLRSEFGLSAKQADDEPNEEVMIHAKIWSLLAEKEKKSEAEQELRSKIGRAG